MPLYLKFEIFIVDQVGVGHFQKVKVHIEVSMLVLEQFHEDLPLSSIVDCANFPLVILSTQLELLVNFGGSWISTTNVYRWSRLVCWDLWKEVGLPLGGVCLSRRWV